RWEFHKVRDGVFGAVIKPGWVLGGLAGPHMYLTVFFFSSRRRHTRSKRDWSSDVCSSDLTSTTSSTSWCAHPASAGSCSRRRLRSEERRVGKECRSRWGSEAYKKRRVRGGTGSCSI